MVGAGALSLWEESEESELVQPREETASGELDGSPSIPTGKSLKRQIQVLSEGVWWEDDK